MTEFALEHGRRARILLAAIRLFSAEALMNGPYVVVSEGHVGSVGSVRPSGAFLRDTLYSRLLVR